MTLNASELTPIEADTVRVQAADRLQKFIRDKTSGGCEIISMGDACPCLLCDVSRLMAITNPNQQIAVLTQQIKEVRDDRVRVWAERDKAMEERDDLQDKLDTCIETISEVLGSRNFIVHVEDYFQILLRTVLQQVSPKPAEPECEHEWVSACNEVVQSGEICKKCLSMRGEDGRVIPVVDVDFQSIEKQVSASQEAAAWVTNTLPPAVSPTGRTSCKTQSVSNTGKVACAESEQQRQLHECIVRFDPNGRACHCGDWPDTSKPGELEPGYTECRMREVAGDHEQG